MSLTYLGYPVEVQKIAFLRQMKIQVYLNGTIKVTSGKMITQNHIYQFLEKHKSWIVKVQKKHRQIREKHPPRKIMEGVSFPYLGIEKPLKIQTGEYKKLQFLFTEQSLLCQKPQHIEHNESDMKKALLHCYKLAGQKWLLKRVEYWSQQMQLYPQKVSVRSQKTRWGSCNAMGHISLNWRLLAAPLPVMDYVVIHELAHLQHHNHSKAFWDLVAKYDGHYKYNRQWLREQQWAFDFLALVSELHGRL